MDINYAVEGTMLCSSRLDLLMTSFVVALSTDSFSFQLILFSFLLWLISSLFHSCLWSSSQGYCCCRL